MSKHDTIRTRRRVEADSKLENLGRKTALGAAWMVFSKLAIRFIGLISTLILVRLLDPEDFGIAAMAMTIVAMVELLTTFGFEVAIIQNQRADADDYNTAWSLNVSLGLAAGTLLLLLAYPASLFYGQRELIAVFAVLSLSTFSQGLENIGLVDFRKHLTFDKEFAFRVSVKVIGFAITIPLAFWLRSYWALVIGSVSTRIATTILSYWAHPYRPSWSFKALDRIMNFSKWLFLNNMVNMFRRVGPDLIIGRISGAKGLGLYSISYEISNLPTTELVAPANRALLPGFSKIADDQARIAKQFVRVAGLLSLLSLPTGFGIAATAELFTPIVLGEDWIAAIPLIQVLALFGAVTAIQSPIATVLMAIGKPKTVSLVSLAQLFFVLPLLAYLNQRFGVIGAAIAMLVTACLALPTYAVLASRQMNVPIGSFTRVVSKPLLAALVMFYCVWRALPNLDPTVPHLLLASSAGAALFVGMIGLLWLMSGRPQNSAEKEIFDLSMQYTKKLIKR